MTMIFPDHAPTRLKVARRSTSADEIRRRLTSGRTDEQEAAVTMLSLVTALGRHDRHTRGHSERVRLFCDLLSRELGLSEADAGRLRWAALIHDIGKLEVAVTVLNKPGRLNVHEWAQIRMHPQAGARLARPLARGSGRGSPASPSTTSASTAPATRWAWRATRSRRPVARSPSSTPTRP